jgi:DNA-directed RNA polymerase specialized sigma24 family protein
MPEVPQGAFLTTRWTRVLLAGRPGADTGENEAREALASLCRDYWYPLYAFARRRGLEVADAQDATQGFFLHLLESGTLSRAKAERGRFRSFLLGSMRNYLNNEHRRGTAQKRGGGHQVLSLDAMAAEGRFSQEPSDPATPEAQFERAWAFALIERVSRRLAEDYERAGRSSLHEKLRPFLAGETARPRYELVAAELGLSTAAVATAVFRMRRRYGELMREEIAETVSTPQEVEEEIAHLMGAVSRR